MHVMRMTTVINYLLKTADRKIGLNLWASRRQKTNNLLPYKRIGFYTYKVSDADGQLEAEDSSRTSACI